MGEPFAIEGWLGFQDRPRRREAEERLLDELGISFEPDEADWLGPARDGSAWRWNVRADMPWREIERGRDAMELLSEVAWVGEVRLAVHNTSERVFVASRTPGELKRRLLRVTAWLVQELNEIGLDAAPELDATPRKGLRRWLDRGSEDRRLQTVTALWKHANAFEATGEPLSAWRSPVDPLLARIGSSSTRALRLFRSGVAALEGSARLIETLSDGQPPLADIAQDLHRQFGETCDSALGIAQLFFTVEGIRGTDLASLDRGTHRNAQDDFERWRARIC
ncbi:MAG: hypothetical protein AAGE52_25355 [Myxococcota bacterium]